MFPPKIEGIEKDDAEKIVNYREARKKMKELLETEAGKNSIQEEIKELDPLGLNSADINIDPEKVGYIVEKSQDKELVERLTVGLREEEKESKKREIKNLISELKKEVEGIEKKLEYFENEYLSEEIKEVLEKDKQEMEKLKLEIENLEVELRKLE